MIPAVLPADSRAHGATSVADGPDAGPDGEATTTFADLLGLALTGAPAPDHEESPPPTSELTLAEGVEGDTPVAGTGDTVVETESDPVVDAGHETQPAVDAGGSDEAAAALDDPGVRHGTQTAIAHAADAAGLADATPGPHGDRAAARSHRPTSAPTAATGPTTTLAPSTDVDAPEEATSSHHQGSVAPADDEPADGVDPAQIARRHAPPGRSDLAEPPARDGRAVAAAVTEAVAEAPDEHGEHLEQPALSTHPDNAPKAQGDPSTAARTSAPAPTLAPSTAERAAATALPASAGRVEESSDTPAPAPAPSPAPAPVAAPQQPAPVTATAPVAPTPPPAPPAPVAPQIVQLVTPLVAGGDGTHELTIELDPVDLGRLRLQITLDDGVVSIRVHADDAGARRLIAESMTELRAALADAGITAGDLDVRDGATDPRDPTPSPRSGGPDDPSADATTPVRHRTRPAGRSALDVLL